MPRKKKPNRAAWGSVSYDARSRVARVRYWAMTPEGYRRCSRTFRDVSRAEAEEKRAALLLEHGRDAPCPTVGDVWARWVLPDLRRRLEEGDIAENTVKEYCSAWRCHVAPRWGGVPCDGVRPLSVQQWLSSMGLSQARAALKPLTRAMDYAVRYEFVDHNPMREKYLMPSRSTVSRHDDGVWTLEELGEAWRAVFGSWLEPAFLLAGFGGCRVGESLGVVAGEVELREVDGVPVAVVSIERQIPNRGAVPTDVLKTPHSRRAVVLCGRAALRLASLAEGLPAGVPLTNDGIGRWQTQTRLTREWRRLGMAHPFRNLRNSWATNCRWALRLPPWIVEPMLGHSGRDVTARHYDRPAAEMYAEYMADAYLAAPYDSGWTWLDRAE